KATFPGGSISGAPKVRAMEIIDELEPTRRGIYTGSLGYLSFDGGMDLNIVIRTFLIKDGKAFFQVGGGIVSDSDPEAEYQETLDKARALIEALEFSPFTGAN
ncbi:MAG: aminodeoxychorismate synthase, component I, partial [Dehalococcoidia bacterium]